MFFNVVWQASVAALVQAAARIKRSWIDHLFLFTTSYDTT